MDIVTRHNCRDYGKTNLEIYAKEISIAKDVFIDNITDQVQSADRVLLWPMLATSIMHHLSPSNFPTGLS